MNHNIYFLFSILSLVLIAPFGAINPFIALSAVGIAGIFFFIWYLKEMKEQERAQAETREVFRKVACEENRRQHLRLRQREISTFFAARSWSMRAEFT